MYAIMFTLGHIEYYNLAATFKGYPLCTSGYLDQLDCKAYDENDMRGYNETAINF